LATEIGTRGGGEELRWMVEEPSEVLEIKGQVGIARGRRERERTRNVGQRERREGGGGRQLKIGRWFRGERKGRSFENLPVDLRVVERVEGEGTYAETRAVEPGRKGKV